MSIYYEYCDQIGPYYNQGVTIPARGEKPGIHEILVVTIRLGRSWGLNEPTLNWVSAAGGWVKIAHQYAACPSAITYSTGEHVVMETWARLYRNESSTGNIAPFPVSPGSPTDMMWQAMVYGFSGVIGLPLCSDVDVATYDGGTVGLVKNLTVKSTATGGAVWITNTPYGTTELSGLPGTMPWDISALPAVAPNERITHTFTNSPFGSDHHLTLFDILFVLREAPDGASGGSSGWIIGSIG